MKCGVLSVTVSLQLLDEKWQTRNECTGKKFVVKMDKLSSLPSHKSAKVVIINSRGLNSRWTSKSSSFPAIFLVVQLRNVLVDFVYDWFPPILLTVIRTNQPAIFDGPERNRKWNFRAKVSLTTRLPLADLFEKLGEPRFPCRHNWKIKTISDSENKTRAQFQVLRSHARTSVTQIARWMRHSFAKWAAQIELVPRCRMPVHSSEGR